MLFWQLGCWRREPHAVLLVALLATLCFAYDDRHSMGASLTHRMPGLPPAQLAKGSAWEQDDEGGPFRPPQWRPFSAMRWLAEYLLAHNAQGNAPNSTEQQHEPDQAHEPQAYSMEPTPAVPSDGQSVAV